MFKRYLSMILLLSFAHPLLYGCAKPPTEEMIKADRVIEEARQKEADIYAHDIFIKAVDSFSVAKELVAAKKYDEARQIAIETVKVAEQAVTVAEVNKESERQKVEELRYAAESLRRNVSEAINYMKSLEKKSFRKGTAEKYEELQKMIIMWEADLINIIDSSREDEMIKSLDELKKLIDKIDAEKEKIQSYLIKKKQG